MKSIIQWMVKSSLALALVVGLSIAGTLPAHAIAVYEADLFATLMWSEQDGIQFGPITEERTSNKAITGDGMGTANIMFDGPNGQGFLTIDINATGQAITPNVVARSGGRSVHEVAVENTSDLVKEVEFSTSFLWNIQGMTTSAPPIRESSFAAAFLFYFQGNTFTNLFDVSSTAPPPFDRDNDGMKRFLVSINPGQTMRVGLLGTVQGETRSEMSNNPIPEPTSILLLGSGIIGLGAWQWGRNKKNQNAA